MALIRRNFAAVALLVLGAACIGLGVYRNEVTTVLRKAVQLCLECVGIG